MIQRITLGRVDSNLTCYWSTKTAGIGAPLAYVSDGDSNGVFCYVGANFGTTAWTNPYTAGWIGLTALDNGVGDNKTTIVDRAASNYSCNVGFPYIVADLFDHALIATYFSYRFRDDTATFSPTAWKLQGSNDNSAWTDLASTSGQTPSISAWVSIPVTPTIYYRYFRILMVGLNNSGTAHFAIGEWELYGFFV